MSKTGNGPTLADDAAKADDITEVRRQEALLETGALQSAIFNSANFSSIATDAKGVIQIFNVGAERMLGYAATEVMNKITPADISDPQEVIARAKALSLELGTPITPGFEALVFKASRGIEDIYELTYIRKDGSRLGGKISQIVHPAPRGAGGRHPQPSANQRTAIVTPRSSAARTRLDFMDRRWCVLTANRRPAAIKINAASTASESLR